MKLKCDKRLSKFAYNLNVCPYIVGKILNVILMVAGSPNKLGFIYTKTKMRLAVGEDVPDVLPYKAGNLRKGLNMYTESNLNKSPPKGLTMIVVTTLEALSGGKDNADDLPRKCKQKKYEDNDECRRNPIQKIFKDCSDKVGRDAC